MEEIKAAVQHAEEARGSPAEIYDKEVFWAKYIPGGYSRERCLKIRGKRMMWALLSLAGCAIMFFGYDAVMMSLINTNEDYLKTMGTAGGTPRDSAMIGGLVSLWFPGFAIGALLVGTYADRIGRLKTIQLGCLWGILGGVLQATSQNLTWMALARVIGGIGCGHLNSVVPIWTSELADPDMRGAFVGVEFTVALSGATMVYWIEYACLKMQSPVFAWRFPLAFQCVFLVVLLFWIPFFPESPRYLARMNRIDEAREVISRCRIHPTEESVEQELTEIQDAIRLEASTTSQSYWTMLTVKDKLHTQRRILLGVGVQIMNKLTGIDFISTYAPEMFTLAGYSGNKPMLLAGGNYFGYTASLALSIYFADRVGRRKMMLLGSTLMGVVLIIGAILSHLTISKAAAGDTTKASQYGAGVATILYLYTFFYGGTWLTTGWVYPTEVFPLASRSKGVALTVVGWSLGGAFVNEIVPYLIKAVGFWVFVLFALINFAMLIPIYLFYIETANRHLEDLDLLLATDSCLYWRAEKQFALHKSRNNGLADNAIEGEASMEKVPSEQTHSVPLSDA